MLVIALATVIGLISGASCQSPVFKDDASDKVTWKFKDRPKLDVSKVPRLSTHQLIGDHENLKLIQFKYLGPSGVGAF